MLSTDATVPQIHGSGDAVPGPTRFVLSRERSLHDMPRWMLGGSMRVVGSDEAIPKDGSVTLSSMFSRIRESTLSKDQRNAARAERCERDNEKITASRGAGESHSRHSGGFHQEWRDSSDRQKSVRAMRV